MLELLVENTMLIQFILITLTLLLLRFPKHKSPNQLAAASLVAVICFIGLIIATNLNDFVIAANTGDQVKKDNILAWMVFTSGIGGFAMVFAFVMYHSNGGVERINELELPDVEPTEVVKQDKR